MKTGRYAALFILNYFSQGLLISVLSLIFIDKGLTLSSIGMGMGVYSLTAVLLEIPSGVAADRFGKKKTFLLSLAVSALSCLVLLSGRGFFRAVTAIALLGAGRALASGSFEALFIDRYRQHFGPDCLPKAIKLLSVCEAAGLASGALLGGMLPGLSEKLLPGIGPYDLNLLLKTVLCGMLAVLLALLIPSDGPPGVRDRQSLRDHIAGSLVVMGKSPNVRWLFIAIAGTGFVLCALESYWQPLFMDLLGNRQERTALLGVVSLLYLGAVMGGNILSEQILTRGKLGYKTVYLVSRLGMLLCVALAAICRNSLLFALFYCLLYFFFGVASISEGAMINSDVPDGNRASILSAQSFVIQTGILSASVVSQRLVGHSIEFFWLIAAGIAAVSMIPSFAIHVSVQADGTVSNSHNTG